MGQLGKYEYGLYWIYYCVSVKSFECDNAFLVVFFKSHFTQKIYVEVFPCVSDVKKQPAMPESGVRSLHLYPWKREWQSIPVFLLGEFHGQRKLVGYSPWGRKESDTTEPVTLHL